MNNCKICGSGTMTELIFSQVINGCFEYETCFNCGNTEFMEEAN